MINANHIIWWTKELEFAWVSIYPFAAANMERGRQMAMGEKSAETLTRKNKVAMAQMSAKTLTETKDLMFQILARLPMKSIMRFHAVCKKWKEIFQSPDFRQLVSTLAVSSAPACIILHEMEPFYLRNLWISTDSSYEFYSLSLDFLPSPVFVVANCESLLCCCSGKDELYICNLVTKTCIKLPQCRKWTVWDFISLAFDTCDICCTLLLGRNSTEEVDTVVDIYDSKTNKWIEWEMPAGNLVRPTREGIYSNGKYYWLNDVHDGESFSIVSLDMQQRQWNTIKGPSLISKHLFVFKSWQTHVKFIGNEGQILLAVGRRLWKINANDVEGEKWSETLDNMGLYFGDFMSGNGSGSDIMELLLSHSDQISIRTFQVNNIWWP